MRTVQGATSLLSELLSLSKFVDDPMRSTNMKLLGKRTGHSYRGRGYFSTLGFLPLCQCLCTFTLSHVARLIRCTMENVLDDGIEWKGTMDDQSFDIISSCIGDEKFDLKADCQGRL